MFLMKGPRVSHCVSERDYGTTNHEFWCFQSPSDVTSFFRFLAHFTGCLYGFLLLYQTPSFTSLSSSTIFLEQDSQSSQYDELSVVSYS